MYLIGYGTRPELIKLFPLINKFKELGIEHKTLFTGQHKDLILEFENLTHKPDFILENTMVHGQSINSLISKIVDQAGKILNDFDKELCVWHEKEYCQSLLDKQTVDRQLELVL